jgi:hypothetical protein
LLEVEFRQSIGGQAGINGAVGHCVADPRLAGSGSLASSAPPLEWASILLST